MSDRALLAAGWWFYDVYFTEDFTRKMFEFVLPTEEHNKRGATMRIVESLEGQLRKYGSDARIKDAWPHSVLDPLAGMANEVGTGNNHIFIRSKSAFIDHFLR